MGKKHKWHHNRYDNIDEYKKNRKCNEILNVRIFHFRLESCSEPMLSSKVERRNGSVLFSFWNRITFLLIYEIDIV